jgi:hypothetical protein
MPDQYTTDLEKRIDYLESMNDRYKGLISKIDSLNPTINISKLDNLLSVEAILGYCQQNFTKTDVSKSAKEIRVNYELINNNDKRIKKNVKVIHYSKDKNSTEQLLTCVNLMKILWENNIANRINLAVDIMDSERYYNPFFYGRI